MDLITDMLMGLTLTSTGSVTLSIAYGTYPHMHRVSYPRYYFWDLPSHVQDYRPSLLLMRLALTSTGLVTIGKAYGTYPRMRRVRDSQYCLWNLPLHAKGR